jgi:Listeria-Bacteroides repeat domain (List_Bact_rpt)/Cadherin-like beta sandwich domain/The GLUG motif
MTIADVRHVVRGLFLGMLGLLGLLAYSCKMQADMESFISDATADTSLASLSLSGVTLNRSFSTTTTSYSITSASSGSFTFTAAPSLEGATLAYTWNGGSGSWASESGTTKTSSSLALKNGSNNLVITVTAPNGGRTRYSVGVTCYIVSYDGNSAASGSAPAARYLIGGGTETLAANSGSLAKTGYTFLGWNTAADGSGTRYSTGDSLQISAGMTFYAWWGMNVATQAELTSALAGLSGSYYLTADIAASGTWTPVGTSSAPFTGTLVGDGHTITYTNTAATTYDGLFGYIGSGGSVQDLNVAGSLKGSSITGAIAGMNYGTISNCRSAVAIVPYGTYGTGGIVGVNYGTVECCAFTGSMVQTSTSCTDVGGIVGRTMGGKVYRCYSTGSISLSASAGSYIGGIIGAINGATTIEECYAVGSVTGHNQIGGLAGGFGSLDTGSSILNCYARGAVSGNSYVGGFTGYIYLSTDTVTNCYATGSYTASSNYGYFVGSNSGTISSSYVANSGGGTYYLSTLSSALPAAWSSSAWGRSSSINGGYPYLLYFGPTNTFTP